MSTPGIVPVSDARRIGRAHDCPVVVVFAIENHDQNRYTITTWGVTKKLCRLAADWGEQLHRAIQAGTVESPAFEPLQHPQAPTSTSHDGPTP